MARFARETCLTVLLATTLACAGVARAQGDGSGSGSASGIQWQWYSASGSGGSGYWGLPTEPPVTEPPSETEEATGDVYTTPAPIPTPQCVVEESFDICERFPVG